MKPNDVTLLVEQTNISLEHLHNLNLNGEKKNTSEYDIAPEIPLNNENSSSSICDETNTTHSNITYVSSFNETPDISAPHSEIIGETSLNKDSYNVVHSNICDGVNEGGTISSKGAAEEEIEEDIHDEIHDLDSAEDVRLLNDPVIKKDLLKEIEIDENKLTKRVSDPFSLVQNHISKKRFVSANQILFYLLSI